MIQSRTKSFISEGESSIAKLLKQNNIPYRREKTYKRCKSISGRLLKFDFFLPKRKTLIEFQGEQHYYVDHPFNDTIEKFQKRQRNDQIKKEFCEKYGYKLIIINFNQKTQIKNLLNI